MRLSMCRMESTARRTPAAPVVAYSLELPALAAASPALRATSSTVEFISSMAVAVSVMRSRCTSTPELTRSTWEVSSSMAANTRLEMSPARSAASEMEVSRAWTLASWALASSRARPVSAMADSAWAVLARASSMLRRRSATMLAVSSLRARSSWEKSPSAVAERSPPATLRAKARRDSRGAMTRMRMVNRARMAPARASSTQAAWV